jgi:hypothetical protein
MPNLAWLGFMGTIWGTYWRQGSSQAMEMNGSHL